MLVEYIHGRPIMPTQPQKQRNNNTTSQQQDGSNNNGKNNSDGGTVYQITSITTRMDPIATEEYPVATAAAADQQSTAPINLAIGMVDGLDHLVESPPFLLTGSSASFSTSNAINERTNLYSKSINFLSLQRTIRWTCTTRS